MTEEWRRIRERLAARMELDELMGDPEFEAFLRQRDPELYRTTLRRHGRDDEADELEIGEDEQ